MTEGFALFCKSYQGDLKAFSRLLKSFAVYNADDLRLFVSVPASDLDAFKECIGTYRNVEVVSDESYAGGYLAGQRHWGMSLGYLNQEICKLSFWEALRAENYLCIDSDAYFIRDFRRADFMFDEGTPYSVLVMDKDLLSDPAYSGYRAVRQTHVERIFKAVELEDPRRLTCHGMTILNRRVLQDLKARFMAPRGLNYSDLLRISPLEFTWYNAWLQKSAIVPVIAVEPFFKTFHTRSDYIFARLKQTSETGLASAYLGIVMNSNWSGREGGLSLPDPNWRTVLLQRALFRLFG